MSDASTLQPQLPAPLVDINSITHPTASLARPLRTLRRSFELLSVSYFVLIYGPAIGFPEFSLRKLEADLDGTQPNSYVPGLAARLLVLLTGDRCITTNNWESRLRREYSRRDPIGNPLGTEPLKTKPRHSKKAVGYVYIAEYIYDTPATAISQSVGVNAQNSPSTPLPKQPPSTKAVNGSSDKHTNPGVGSSLIQSDEVNSAELTTTKTVASEPLASAPIQPKGESQLDAIQTQTEADTSPVTQPAEQAPIVSEDQLPQTSSCNDSTPADLTSGVIGPLGHQDQPEDSLLAPKEISTTSNDVSTIDEPTHLAASGTNPDTLPSHLTTQEDDEPTHLAIPWSELSPLIKLRALFKLCEWNFETAHDLDRFRRMIEGKATGFAGINALTSTSTDPVDSGDWRQERCGVDSNLYSYWFTGQGIDATLWVQRPEPKPKTKITLRLSSSKGKARGKQSRASNSRSNKRSLDVAGPETAPDQTTDSNPKKGTSLSNNTPKSKRPRLSGTRTSSRLRKSSGADDWQTDSLELDSARSSHLNSPSTLLSSARPPTMIVIKNGALPTAKSKTLERIVSGTRASPRRRVGDDDEWQDVPEGWLDEVVMSTASQNTKLNPETATQDQSTRSAKFASQSQTPLDSKLPPKSGAPASSVLSSELSDDLTSEDEAQQPIKKKLPSAEMAKTDPQVKIVPEDAAHVDVTSTKADVADVPEPIEVNGQQVKEPEVTVELAQADSDVKMEIETMPIAHVRFELVTAMEESGTSAPPAEANGDRPPESEILPTEPVGVESDVKMVDGTIQNPHIKPSLDQTSDVPSVSIESVDVHSKDPDAVPTESLEVSPTLTANCTAELTEERNEGDTTMLNPYTNPSHETEVQVKADEDEEDPDQLKGHPLDPDWIGWEVVCSNLSEWQQFPRQFEGTQHPDEIALITLVTEEVLPVLVKAHQEHENRLKLEEAMAQRKRSNRIATREVVQISAAEAAEAAVAVSERETRLHSERLEARRLKEKQATEDRAEKEEDHRLVRLREREERIALREAQVAMERDAEKKREERARLRAEAKGLGLAVKVARSGAENSVSPTDASESWELDCEICGVMGKNMDDGSEVICCDKCEKWQHLACHDNADQIRRLPKRDWSKADFVCSACSGIPIPRSVKHLRTHVNGKPKRPRTRKLKANGVEGGANDATQATRPKQRITLFVNDPDKRGEGSLSQVHPNKNLATPMASNISQQPPFSQITQPLDNKPINGHIAPALTDGFHQNPIFFKGELSPSISPHISPALTGVQPSPVSPAPVPACTGLEAYYDDLDKLIPILRANVHLHRVLPVSVMHRVRRYLIDQQQRRQSTTALNGSSSNPTHLTPTPNVFSIPPKPMMPLIAQLNPSLPVNIEPTQPLPPIGSALPTAADWYDQHHVKSSTTSIESFVDPIFASPIKLESKVGSTIPKDEEQKVERVDNKIIKPELQTIPPKSGDHHQSQTLSL